MPAPAYHSEVRIWCWGYCLHMFVKRESGSKIMSVFLTESFGRTALPLKLKESLISEFLWPRISISLLSRVENKVLCQFFLCCCREMKDLSTQRFRDFFNSCFVLPSSSEMSEHETFSFVSLGVSLQPARNESILLPQKCNHTLLPEVEHQSDSRRICYKYKEVEGRILLDCFPIFLRPKFHTNI